MNGVLSKVSLKNVLLGVIGSLALLFTVFMVITVFAMSDFLKSSRYDVHDAMSSDEQAMYSAMALLPDMAGNLERYGVRETTIRTTRKTINYTVLDTCTFADIDQMCEALPASVTRAIREAVERGEPERQNDIAQVPVDCYSVNNRELPLSEAAPMDSSLGVEESQIKRFFNILVYEDGSCRFSIFLQITK